MQRSLEQRMAIKFCVKLEKSAAKTIPMLKKAFGVDCLSDRQIFRWTRPSQKVEKMQLTLPENIYREVIQEIGVESPICCEHLPNLKYTERAILESLRLLPVIPMVGRLATADIRPKLHEITSEESSSSSFLAYPFLMLAIIIAMRTLLAAYLSTKTIPAGSSILISIYNLHRSEKYWKDPLEYNPDRFSPEEVAQRDPYVFIPFSSGQRNCIVLMGAVDATLKILTLKRQAKCERPRHGHVLMETA
ncbi:hypothetical protein NQ318_010510 [Aromia moschata]|uniref:Cytochrome P450 n=1 Tax=Aromia moschata TaxID=1265417 RepID=A0AAV8YHC9_9CUCU|nr:hypothetical protein NQ318_010510 [Aromia moschata]